MPAIPAVHLVVGCGGPAGAKCLGADAGNADPVRLDIHAAQITLRDVAPPAIAGRSGPLTEAGRTQAGATSVTAHALDAGAGVASVALEVDGKVVASAGAPGCAAAPYTSPTPCPADVSQTLGLDTNTLAFGTHTARVVVTDASGSATGSAPFAVRVDNRHRAAFGATLSYSYRGRGRGTRFTRLTARRVPAGTTISFACSGGRKRGCAVKSKRVVKSARKSTYSLLSVLKRRTLRPGARLTVRMTARDGSVQRRTLKIRSKAPKQTTRCREGAAGARYGSCG
jgi:hypothetical protein